MPIETILAADVGGTNTRFDLYEVDTNNLPELRPNEDAPGKLLFSKKYMNQDFNSFVAVLQRFLEEARVGRPPVTACFAVAGPVANNKVQFTNRASWSVDGAVISRLLGIEVVRLVNDFVANGYGLLCLDESSECVVLQSGPKVPTAPIACIGAGTGLGECFLAPDGAGSYSCFPTEGGHAEFAPRNELEFRLLQYLMGKFEQKHRISVERVVSGSGLANVYEFLVQDMPDKVNAEVNAAIDAAGELKGAVIATSAGRCELCRKTMEIFTTAYGAEAGVAALKWLPYGGLYLTGGLTPKNLALLQGENGPFLRAFRDKGRVSGMLYTIPIFAVTAEDLGERGARRVAYQDLLTLRKSGGSSSSSPASGSGSAGAIVKKPQRESLTSIWLRRAGYMAMGYVVLDIALGVWMLRSSNRSSQIKV